MTYIIIDFEATCSDINEFPREEMEIIEWGVVAVDKDTLKPIDEFNVFVRPVMNPLLTSFCKELTSITQEDVDKGEYFPRSLELFKDWLERFDSPLFCSWGLFDKNQLMKDCDYHNVDYPFSEEHINIKHVFTLNNKITKKRGLANCMRRANIEFEGTQHRGIDDARNMVKLLPYIFGDKRINK